MRFACISAEKRSDKGFLPLPRQRPLRWFYEPLVFEAALYNKTGGTNYLGIAFGGTLCPDSGCVPFIVPVQTPAPVAGSGIVGLLLVATLLLGKVRAVAFSAGGDGRQKSVLRI